MNWRTLLLASLTISLIFLLASGFNSTNETTMIFKSKDPFKKDWAKIDSLKDAGLYKQALTATEDLIIKLRKEDMPDQFVTALIYQTAFSAQVQEAGYENAITSLEGEIENATQPVKALLQSISAQQYDQYRARNMWKINNRTASTGVDLADIQTWSAEDFAARTSALYLASIQDPESLKISLDSFPKLVKTFKETTTVWPTLYDLLAFRALDYMESGNNYLSKPAYKFNINEPEALDDYKAFLKLKWDTKDQESLDLKALHTFQDLIKYHQNDKKKDAFLHADLRRLEFVYNKSQLENKDELYLQTLEAYKKQFKSDSSVAEVIFKIADYYHSQGNKYQPGPNDAFRYEKNKALDLCLEVLENYQGSYGAKLCGNLRSSILQKDLSVNIEKVNLPDEQLLARVEFQNINTAYFRIVELDEKDEEALYDLDQYARIDYLAKKNPKKKWSVELPKTKDFQKHATEIMVNSLPCGRYYLLIANNQDFSTKGKAAGYKDFHVSKLSLINRQIGGKQHYYVIDRKSGKPLSGVKAEIYYKKYNSKERKYRNVQLETLTSDLDGYFICEQNHNNSITIKLTKGRDKLVLGDYYYEYKDRKDKPYTQTHFFLDRAIYRPGQTVYFKGLIIDYDSERMPEIKKNLKSKVTLLDANYQEVGEVEVRTNKYGTYHGSFIVPSSGLLGTMNLKDEATGSRKNFQVEEYKRPKFETKFEPVEGSFKLEEQITVKGKAQAFAGNNIDGALVKYRVVREVRFPFWRWWYWGWFNPYKRESMEITSGETQTDENGDFNVEFTAIPDNSIPEEQKPQFTYVVYADVVDITGETQSAETRVSVGYVSMLLKANLPDKIERDKLDKVEIQATNLNGQPVLGQGTAKLEKLKAPKTWYKQRLWEKPDIRVIAKNDFSKNFPHLAFEDEDMAAKQPVESQVELIKFDTEMSKHMYFDKKKMKPGTYKLSVESMDPYGQAVELVKFFTVYEPESKTLATPEPFYHNKGKQTLEPGETHTFQTGSSAEDTRILFEVEWKGEIVTKVWLQPNQIVERAIKIEEKHRGNLAYHLTMIKDSRKYGSSFQLLVPWSNKDLKIEYATFRNKLLPGEKEKWQLKLSGPKADQIAAEMAVTMYDASLDQFAANYWSGSFYPSAGISTYMGTGSNFSMVSASINGKHWQSDRVSTYRNFPYLTALDIYSNVSYSIRGSRNDRISLTAEPLMDMAAAPMPKSSLEEVVVSEGSNPPGEFENDSDADGVVDLLDAEPTSKEDFSEVKVRTNLNETVFFFPELKTDKDGNVIIEFTMNEALTRWKFLGFAITEDLEYAFTENEVVTQKELMIVPNVPRFLRENDKIELTAKVSNLSEGKLSGMATLRIFDALTMQPLDGAFGNSYNDLAFEVEKGLSTPVKWRIEVPQRPGPIVYQVIAKAGDKSDGEENGVPVLTNRMMVTETLPLPVRGKQTRKFTFKGMEKAKTSTTLSSHKLTLEFTSNPAWYAVQALPYLMEYPYECTEQIFSRYYANTLASSVANSHPKIKQVFERWKNTDALESNLSKNQELKSALLEETPWVLQSQNEASQKKRIGLLFDLNNMANEQKSALKTLMDRQLSNGGFSWFPGGRDSWYITQYLMEGMGHLDKLGVTNVKGDPDTREMVRKAIQYIDDRMAEYYEDLLTRVKAQKNGNLEDDHLSDLALHYLYTRSFFTDIPIQQEKTREAKAYFLGQAKKYWLKRGLYNQAMMTLSLSREGEKADADKIAASLKDRALYSDEMGMYWKYASGWFWYEAPVETHSLLIEVFAEVAKDSKSVDDLKVWLLKNKQTNHWKTTKATANAVYALLSNGDNWLLDDAPVKIKLGKKFIEPIAQQSGEMTSEPDPNRPVMEPGTGYFKTSWDGKSITPDMANIEVENPNNVVAWGALYWQYFEQLDKIETFKETPLTIQKDVMLEENSPTGPKLSKVTSDTKLEPGDKLMVRIELRVDRDMEYVHMKDMRASGLEPINVISRYKWQGGLGYYESTRDVSTNFFFSYLPKGTYVFEYPLRVNHKGDFSNGITSIQCMYAPEFSSHSEGIRIQVD